MELGQLTVIAGRNNTGKTYLVYTLYGLLDMWRGWPSASVLLDEKRRNGMSFPDFSGASKALSRVGHFSAPLFRDSLKTQRQVLTKSLVRDFSKHALPDVFSSRSENFPNSSIEVVLRDDPYVAGRSSIRALGSNLELHFADHHLNISANPAPPESDELQRILSDLYVWALLGNEFDTPFILSAERFGISLFFRELDFTRNQLVEVLQNLAEEEKRNKFSPYVFIDKATSRYAKPIKDNIDFTRDIPVNRKKSSELSQEKLFEGVKEMMAGYYQASGDDLFFVSKARKEKRFKIPLHLASSSARGLSDLYFFLRHLAKKGHLLMIDEPESHLDTANQIELARLLARLVRAGLKVLITTHSDYLIKELNNLIMLSSPNPNNDEIRKTYGYGESDCLSASSVKAYIAENGTLTACVVDELGMDIPVFDETIDRINQTSNALSENFKKSHNA